MRILCTGDLHIGRFPSHVPLSDRSLSVEAAWERAVTLALDEGVDAVVLTGDVADQDNKLFEALGPLRVGVARLWAAGVRTIAVAGNHDYDVLRRLAGLVDAEAFTLLGVGGTWSTTLLERDGTPALRFVGWSFPTSHVRTSPLDTFPTLGPGLPTIGVVHGDLDQSASAYAPLNRASLAAAPVAGWLLGHIHKPLKETVDGTLLLYPGSLQPLDPGEAGPHGPWIVSLQPDGTLAASQRPEATIRYDRVDVDLSEIDLLEDAETALTTAVDEHLGRLCLEQPALRHAVVDVHLGGRTGLFSALPNLAESATGQSVPGPSAEALIRRVHVDARPAHDLKQVALRNDPAGASAALLLSLQADDETARDLLDQAVRTVRSVDAAPAFSPLGRAVQQPEDAREAARGVLIEQGYRLLDGLLSQTSAD